MNGLDEFGFNLEKLDPSLVYRVLRELEMVGMVASNWDSKSLGPQRRVYEITTAGEKHLAEWMQDLRKARQEIEALEAAYERVDVLK
jgi:DNA-binding PadR family transcriptional regulator